MAAALEAQLLTRRPFEAITERVRIPVDVIARYQNYFFSLGDRINDRTFVVEHAIASDLEHGLPPATAKRYATLRFIGYFCGPEALDRVLWAAPAEPYELWHTAADAVNWLSEFEDLQSVLGWAAGSPSHTKSGRSLDDVIARLSSGRLGATKTNVLGITP
jgi:hypothetical protein